MQSVAGSEPVDRSEGRRRSHKSCGRRTQLVLLFILDVLVVIGMIYATTMHFASAANYTPTLDETFTISGSSDGTIAKTINDIRLRLLYLVYVATSVFAAATTIYTFTAIFRQYRRRKAWEINHIANTEADGVFDDEGGRLPTDAGRAPRDRCSDMTRYFYAAAWMLAWIATGIGILVEYLDRSGWKLLGLFGVKAQEGSRLLAGAWVLLMVVGLWRVVYKVASNSG